MPDRPTTHASHLDDSMAAEAKALTRGAPVEARAQEHRMVEPPDDDVDIEAILEFASEPLPGTLGESERRRRSELAAALRPHVFPAERDELLRVAEREQAAAWILDALEQLPIDTRFDTPQDVWLALGGHRETREVRDGEVHEVSVEHVPAAEPAPAAGAPVPPTAVEADTGGTGPNAPSGMWRDLAQLGVCIVRIPFAVAGWGARTLRDRFARC